MIRDLRVNRDFPFAQGTFHSVGQGMFYSCHIWLRRCHEPLTVVYDCGSSSKKEYLESEIDYLIAVGVREIDMLIISHFDRDHVNGIPRLLKLLKVKSVYMPYLTPRQRLLVYARNYETAKRRSTDYDELVTDPAGYFIRKGVPSIFFLGSSGLPTETPQSGQDGPDDGPGDGPGDRPDDRPDDGIGTNLEIDGEFSEQVYGTEGLTGSDRENVQVRKVSPKRRRGAQWNFEFFSEPMDAAIANSLFSSLKGPPLNITTNKELKAALRDKGKMKNIREAYEKTLGGSKQINEASLCVAHYPNPNHWFTGQLVGSNDLFVARLQSVCKTCGNFLPREAYQVRIFHTNGATILFGDSNFSGSNFTRLFASNSELMPPSCFRNAAVASLPHHGSDLSWDPDALESVICRSWVVSSKFASKHHPGCKTVQDVLSGYPCRKLFAANEFNRVSYTIFPD